MEINKRFRGYKPPIAMALAVTIIGSFELGCIVRRSWYMNWYNICPKIVRLLIQL